jgi:hypothetical protein
LWGSAYNADPYNIESIAEGMNKVFTDDTLRQNLIEKGLKKQSSLAGARLPKNI